MRVDVILLTNMKIFADFGITSLKIFKFYPLKVLKCCNQNINTMARKSTEEKNCDKYLNPNHFIHKDGTMDWAASHSYYNLTKNFLSAELGIMPKN